MIPLFGAIERNSPLHINDSFGPVHLIVKNFDVARIGKQTLGAANKFEIFNQSLSIHLELETITALNFHLNSLAKHSPCS